MTSPRIHRILNSDTLGRVIDYLIEMPPALREGDYALDRVARQVYLQGFAAGARHQQGTIILAELEASLLAGLPEPKPDSALEEQKPPADAA